MQDINELMVRQVMEAMRREQQGGQRTDRGFPGTRQRQPDPSVYGQMIGGQSAPPDMAGMAAQAINPEDYDYMVNIERRDIFDPEDPEKVIGWDKNVIRWAQRRDREPTLGDLSDESMRKRDRKRDKSGRFVAG